jgi:hypothetical protein
VKTLTNFAADAETGFFTTSRGGREPRNPVYKRFLCYEQIRDCPFFFSSLRKNRQILFLSAEGYYAQGYDAES